MPSRPSALASILAIGATALALSMPAAQATPAAAQVQTIKSNVTFSKYVLIDSNVKFIGKVKSRKIACQKRRTVKLRQVEQGISVGRDKTSSTGKWAITFDGSIVHPGEFKMTVTRKVIRKSGKKIVCKADTTTQQIS